MKYIYNFIAITLVFSFASSALLSLYAIAETKTHTLEVKVEGYTTISGNTLIALYNSKTAFDNNSEPVDGYTRQVTHNSDTFVFTGIPAGTYAVKLFHDANENGYIDFAQNGVPIESWGLSKLKSTDPMYRSPQFEDADFTLDRDGKMIIQLRK